MVVQRQPIDRLIDLAVGLPVVAVLATRRGVPLVARATKLGMTRVARRVRRHPVSATALPPRTRVADKILEPAEVVPVPTVTVTEIPARLPIDDYDHLAARQVVDRLATLSAAELADIASYERKHRHRRTVLGRIAQLQS